MVCAMVWFMCTEQGEVCVLCCVLCARCCVLGAVCCVLCRARRIPRRAQREGLARGSVEGVCVRGRIKTRVAVRLGVWVCFCNRLHRSTGRWVEVKQEAYDFTL